MAPDSVRQGRARKPAPPGSGIGGTGIRACDRVAERRTFLSSRSDSNQLPLPAPPNFSFNKPRLRLYTLRGNHRRLPRRPPRRERAAISNRGPHEPLHITTNRYNFFPPLRVLQPPPHLVTLSPSHLVIRSSPILPHSAQKRTKAHTHSRPTPPLPNFASFFAFSIDIYCTTNCKYYTYIRNNLAQNG